MTLIYTRSPYFISVNETGQTGARVKLYIWNKGTTEPTTPTYIISKNIPSPTQTELNFNISNYVREFIDNIAPVPADFITLEENNAWCFVKVEQYSIESGGDKFVSETTYIATNGYTKYLDGFNESTTDLIIPLTNDLQTIYYNRDGVIPYINTLFLNPDGYFTIEARWTYIDSGDIIDSFSTSELGNFNYAISVANTPVEYDNGNVLQIIDATNYEELRYLAIYKIIPIDECKYTPVLCSFINAMGGWQFLTFFKAQTNNINVKGSTYKMMPSALDYNIAQPQTKSFNINGTQSVKLNTGWVDENYSDIITQLLLSETVLLDGKPVDVKTQSSTLKTSLKDKMINYEIDFDYAFGLINDVI